MKPKQTPVPWQKLCSNRYPLDSIGTALHRVDLIGTPQSSYPAITISSICHTNEEVERFEANVDLIIKAVNVHARVTRKLRRLEKAFRSLSK